MQVRLFGRLPGCVCHHEVTWTYINDLINNRGHRDSAPQNSISTNECIKKKGNRITSSAHLCSKYLNKSFLKNRCENWPVKV